MNIFKSILKKFYNLNEYDFYDDEIISFDNYDY